MFSLLQRAGSGGLTTEEWNERARNEGIGVNRKADLYDIRGGSNRRASFDNTRSVERVLIGRRVGKCPLMIRAEIVARTAHDIFNR